MISFDRLDPPPNGMKFPNLPIIPAEEVRKSQAEKYGGLFYLGVLGLVVLVGLIGWFGWGLWSLRQVWADVYILNDPVRSEPDRMQAAQRLALDPRFSQRQRFQLCLDPHLPDQARFRLATSLTAEAVLDDPRAYTEAVAEFEQGPDRLRILLLRPMAYAADRVHIYRVTAMSKLLDQPDPLTRVWASFANASTRKGARTSAQDLTTYAEQPGLIGEIASLLRNALERTGGARTEALDAASQRTYQGFSPQPRNAINSTVLQRARNP